MGLDLLLGVFGDLSRDLNIFKLFFLCGLSCFLLLNNCSFAAHYSGIFIKAKFGSRAGQLVNLNVILLVDPVVELSLLRQYNNRVLLAFAFQGHISFSLKHKLVDSAHLLMSLSIFSGIKSHSQVDISLLEHSLDFRV